MKSWREKIISATKNMVCRHLQLLCNLPVLLSSSKPPVSTVQTLLTLTLLTKTSKTVFKILRIVVNEIYSH